MQRPTLKATALAALTSLGACSETGISYDTDLQAGRQACAGLVDAALLDNSDEPLAKTCSVIYASANDAEFVSDLTPDDGLTLSIRGYQSNTVRVQFYDASSGLPFSGECLYDVVNNSVPALFPQYGEDAEPENTHLLDRYVFDAEEMIHGSEYQFLNYEFRSYAGDYGQFVLFYDNCSKVATLNGDEAFIKTGVY